MMKMTTEIYTLSLHDALPISLLIMESAGMMKMATGEGFPLRQGAGTGLDWFSVATEACGGGTPDLGFFLGVSVFIGIYGGGITSVGPTRRSQAW